MNRTLFSRLAVLSLIFLVAITYLSCLPLVKADTYNQIPLWINIMEGATVDETKIEKEIDQIFKENGLNWRVTSVVLNDNYTDPDKSHDQPGEVRVADSGFTDEENSLWNKGKSETKDKGGFKIFVVPKILDENGTDSGTNGVSMSQTGTAIVAQPSARDPPIGGSTWGHELGHLFGLNHTNSDGSARPTDDLMYTPRSQRNGTKLSAGDIAQMNTTKIERDLGLPTLTNDQLYRTYDMYREIIDDLVGDSFYDFTDILEAYIGFYILDATRELHITTFLNGLVPSDVSFTYYIALNTDNDPSTGGTFMDFIGVDFLIIVTYYSAGIPLEALLYKYPEYVPISMLEARIDTHSKQICKEDTAADSIPVSNSIVVSMPLGMLVPLANFMRIGSYMESADGLGTDKLMEQEVATTSPERPQLLFDPPVGCAGTMATARGFGFTPAETVSIIFAHDELASTFVDPDGTFVTMFAVPSLPADHYMVDAIDGSNKVGVNMFTILPDLTPPEIHICSPQNETYYSNTVPLVFTLNEHASWIGYSLDDASNVTIDGNTTLTFPDPSLSTHKITVYAADMAGNEGASETIYFSVNPLFYDPWQTSFIMPDDNPVVDMTVYNSKLHVASDELLGSYDGASWNLIQSPNINSLMPYGSDLIAGTDKGLWAYDGTFFRMLFPHPGHMKILGEYNGRLYAGTMLSIRLGLSELGPLGIFLYYCPDYSLDPHNWIVDEGFAEILQFKGLFGGIDCFATYNGAMYVTCGDTVYAFNGVSWGVAKVFDGVRSYTDIKIHNGKLYLATEDQSWSNPLCQEGSGFSGRVIEFDGTNWATILDHDYTIFSLETYDGKLYAGTANKILTYDGSGWSVSFEATEEAYYAVSMTTYDTKIYAGMGNGHIFVDPAETNQIPEFPSAVILALFAIFATFASVLAKRKARKLYL